MSRTVPAALATHLALATTTLAVCWKIKRQDGTIKAFTSSSSDLSVNLGDGDGAQTYKAAGGHLPTAMGTAVSLSVDSMDGTLILDSTLGIARADVLAGYYDGAEVKIFVVNWNQTTIPTGEAIMLFRGRVGRAQITDLGVAIELRSLSDAFNQEIGEVISPTCRAQFTDARCTLNAATWTHTAEVTAVTSNSVFRVEALTGLLTYYPYAKATWTSGANNGLSSDVKTATYISPGGAGKSIYELTLQRPAPNTVAVGDDLSVLRGCDKLFSTCKATFSNQLNFQGEPHVPGITRVSRIPPER